MDPAAVMAFVLIIGLRCLMGWASSSLGLRRGRSPTRWFWAGFCFGVIGIILAACMSKVKPA